MDPPGFADKVKVHLNDYGYKALKYIFILVLTLKLRYHSSLT